MRRLLSDESGFTLTEMLVGILASVAVIGATFAILDMSLKLNSRIADQVDSNQGAHTAMERIGQLLQSSCISPAYPPVLSGSSDTSLQFISEDQTQSSKVVPQPVKHVIALNGTSLQDTQYAYSSGAGTNLSPYVFSNTPVSGTPITLLSGVSKAKNGSDNTTQQPIFTYYKYNGSGELPLFTSVQDQVNSNLPYSTTSYFPPGLTTPLSSSDAGNTAEVAINFTAAPQSGVSGQSVSGTGGSRTLTLSDAFVLRFTASSAAGSSAPCD